MTKKEFRKKIKELLKADGGLLREIEIKALTLFESGGVNTPVYSNDFELPKIILTACCEYFAHEYMPFSKEGKKVVKNLSRF